MWVIHIRDRFKTKWHKNFFTHNVIFHLDLFPDISISDQWCVLMVYAFFKFFFKEKQLRLKNIKPFSICYINKSDLDNNVITSDIIYDYH